MSLEVKKKKKENGPTTSEEAVSLEAAIKTPESEDTAEVKVTRERRIRSLAGTEAGDESDLDAFEEQWSAKGSGQTASEYHKKDAPHMESESWTETHEPRVIEISKKIPREKSHPMKESSTIAIPESGENEGRLKALSDKITSIGTPSPKEAAPQRIIDISTIEVLGFTFFRALFGKGIRVPLKIEGSMDMDISVKDTNVVINTNDVSFEPPKLQIWHFIIAYKGKPVLEYGRGVERIRVHYYRALVVLLAMWWGGKQKRRAKEKANRAADRELLARAAAANARSEAREGTGGVQ